MHFTMWLHHKFSSDLGIKAVESLLPTLDLQVAHTIVSRHSHPEALLRIEPISIYHATVISLHLHQCRAISVQVHQAPIEGLRVLTFLEMLLEVFRKVLPLADPLRLTPPHKSYWGIQILPPISPVVFGELEILAVAPVHAVLLLVDGASLAAAAGLDGLGFWIEVEKRCKGHVSLFGIVSAYWSWITLICTSICACGQLIRCWEGKLGNHSPANTQMFVPFQLNTESEERLPRLDHPSR